MPSQAIDFTVFRGSNTGSIVSSTSHRDSLKGDEVLIKITHSGLCFSDMHYRQSGQGLGHEGVGIIQRLGPDVHNVKECVSIPSSPLPP